MDIRLEEKVELIENWLRERKADDIVSIDVRDKCSFTEYIIVCHGTATLHNRAIADHVLDKCYENKVRILGKEGMQTGVWILIDLNDVIVHVFSEEMKETYNLEDLWTKKITIQDI